MRAADDLFFDSVSQVRLLRWRNARIVLLGDAASCVSLFGDSSTMAMAGAFTLAEELAAGPNDPESAFRRTRPPISAWSTPSSGTSDRRRRSWSLRRGAAPGRGT
ncbi:hypothetical protein [Streptosporangium sp. NPDC087985]|uniref:hypothetical protein n=1 Tax=Streptosporangium sp. NPDC087985 TaxID=3366196 RepID=UPI00382E7926